jgi:hypothetical protein
MRAFLIVALVMILIEALYIIPDKLPIIKALWRRWKKRD